MDPDHDRITADASALHRHLLLVIAGDENMTGGPMHCYYPGDLPSVQRLGRSAG